MELVAKIAQQEIARHACLMPEYKGGSAGGEQESWLGVQDEIRATLLVQGRTQSIGTTRANDSKPGRAGKICGGPEPPQSLGATR